MSRSGSSTLTPSEIATAEELVSNQSEGISEEVHLESEIISFSSKPHQHHPVLIQVQKM